MVKPDVKRNYYQDLELSPNADPQEITKAFRKLAKLYHPDRNPGKEEEYVPKFQAIQAAHEILSDPAVRAKYDEDRRRYGYTQSFARPNNSVRNPYAQSYYRPPPPARPQQRPAPAPAQAAAPPPPPPPPQSRPQSYAGPQSSSSYYNQSPFPGATRFHAFGRAPAPPPPTPPRGSKDEQQARADAWSAWEHMRRKPPTAKATFADGTTDRTQRANNDTANAHKSKPGLGRSQTTKTPRKAGFDPSNLGSEWEPAATRTSSYTNFAKAPFAPGTFTPPPPPPGPPPPNTAKLSPNDGRKRESMHNAHRATSADDVPYFEGGDRIRTPYMSHTGEKTYFSSAFLGRSTSNREEAKMTSTGPTTPNNAEKQTDQAARTQSHSPRVGEGMRDARGDGSKTQDGARPAANTGLPRSAAQTAAPRQSSHGKMGQSNNVFSMYASSSEESGSSPFADRSSDVESPGNTPEAGPFGKAPPRAKARPGKAWANRSATQSDGDISKTSSNENRPPSQYQPANATTDSGFKTSTQADTPIFSAPFYTPGHTPDVKKETKGNINTQFSAANWSGKFTGSEFAMPPPPPPIPPGTQRRQTRSMSRRAGSPAKQDSVNGKHWFDESATEPVTLDGPEVQQEDLNNKTTRPPGPVKFSSEEWSKQFKEANWAFPPPPPISSSASPAFATSRRGSRTPVTRKGSKPDTKVPTVSVTDESDETAKNKKTRDPSGFVAVPPTKPASVAGATNTSGTIDSDIMDVDSPPTSEPTGRQPRMVQVEPTRPEWRDSKAPAAATTFPTIHADTTQEPTKQPTPSIQSSLKQETPHIPVNTESPSVQPDRPIFQEFANITPLAPSGNGIQGISDIATSLPFDSKPASSLTTSKPLTPQKLELPPVPRGPSIPSGAITQMTWKTLLAKMSAYMGQWYTFETQVLDHFNTRHQQAARFGTGLPSSDATRLLEQIGEPSGLSSSSSFSTVQPAGPNALGNAPGTPASTHNMRAGLKAYKRDLEEDERVRRAWGLACEKHRAVVEGFIGVKERILRDGFAVVA